MPIESFQTQAGITSGKAGIYDPSGPLLSNISEAVSDGIVFNTTSLPGGSETAPEACAFSSDGSQLYVVGRQKQRIFQYALSTVFDPSTAADSSQNLHVAPQDSIPQALTFSPDGMKLYMCGVGSDSVHQYSLSTAWEVGTAAYDTKAIDCVAVLGEASPQGLVFSPDGTKLFIGGGVNSRVYRMTLSTAWDISTATYSNNFKSITVLGEVRGIGLDPLGKALLVLDRVAPPATTDRVLQYDLGTPYDLTTAIDSGYSVGVASSSTSPQGFTYVPTANKFFIVGNTAAEGVSRWSVGLLASLLVSALIPAAFVVAQDWHMFNIIDGVEMGGAQRAQDALDSIAVEKPSTLIINGDLLELEASDATSRMAEVVQKETDFGFNIIHGLGNHDIRQDNGLEEYTTTRGAAFFNGVKDSHILSNPNDASKGYFAHCDPFAKVMHIVLNSVENKSPTGWYWNPEQAAWLQSWLDDPANQNMRIVVYSHVPPRNVGPNGWRQAESDQLHSMLSTWHANHGKVLSVFSGHVHQSIYEMVGDIHYIILRDSQGGGIGPTATANLPYDDPSSTPLSYVKCRWFESLSEFQIIGFNGETSRDLAIS